jgi:hypothetical protein
VKPDIANICFPPVSLSEEAVQVREKLISVFTSKHSGDLFSAQLAKLAPSYVGPHKLMLL